MRSKGGKQYSLAGGRLLYPLVSCCILSDCQVFYHGLSLGETYTLIMSGSAKRQPGKGLWCREITSLT